MEMECKHVEQGLRILSLKKVLQQLEIKGQKDIPARK